ncbi:hypothetical protein Zmor_008923 [Zophobas morio]|uniref:TGS domain-containing protein n=2 Tax=Zophobas morio TaxID=2755281 RepID=A0AA38HHR6_9CUCU|nr:hypothetical protein Zmor_008923 [Zophobas morio]
MGKVRALLEANKPVRDAAWTTPEVELICKKLYMLLTTKPCVYLINLSADDFVRKKNKWLVKIKSWIDGHGGGAMIPMSVEYEQALHKMRDDPLAYNEAVKTAKSVLPRAIKVAYHELGLIHFLTAGEKEVRCWTVLSGATAPQAAGVIHSDFERGFIKAEVVSFEDWKEYGKNGMAGVRAAGKQRQEGKSYIIKDGDIVHFHFNVTSQKKK